MEKASSAEDLLQMCLAALESESGEAGVRERLGLPPQDGSSNGKQKDVGAVQKALLQVRYPHLRWCSLNTRLDKPWCTVCFHLACAVPASPIDGSNLLVNVRQRRIAKARSG